jgi:ankyrin repeat protein
LSAVATKDDITAMSSDGARLITVATDNDEKAVKAFLNDKVDVNSRDWDLLTPLIAASGKGHLSMAKFLVSKTILLLSWKLPWVVTRIL